MRPRLIISRNELGYRAANNLIMINSSVNHFLAPLFRAVVILLACQLPTLRATVPIAVQYRVGGFAIGPQAYSFRLFTVSEAIEKMQQAGGKVIELSNVMKFSKERPEVFNHKASPELVRLVQAKLEQHGIKAVNYGVVEIPNDEAGARKVFEFARTMELGAIITESIASLDLIEKLVKEYDIKVGIHQHARNDAKPGYQIWDPRFVRELLKNRDHRIGACADTGHWATSGIDPLDAVKILKGRIISAHLKERTVLGKQTEDAIFGTGITDTAAILKELKKQGFKGNISIEYEANWDNSVPDVAQCVGFIRGWGMKK